jgi:CRP-like cAMP-binding protein
MKQDAVDPLKVLQLADCFKGVEPALMAELAGNARLLEYQKDEVITRLGQHFDHLAVIARGQIELSISNRAGKRHVLNVMLPGQIYGLIPMLDGKPLYYGATALTPCTMVALSRENMISSMHRSSTLMMGVLGVMCARSRDTFSAMADQHLLSPTARLARYLLRLALVSNATGNGKDDVFTVEFSQGDLSDMLGISRQSLNAAMKQLEQLNLIQKQYSKVRLLSIAALKELVTNEL